MANITNYIVVEVYDMSSFRCQVYICVCVFQGTGSISNNTTTNDQVETLQHIQMPNISIYASSSLKTHSVSLLKVCSSRPVQQQSEMSAQNCSMEEDDKEGTRVEKRSDEGRGEL